MCLNIAYTYTYSSLANFRGSNRPTHPKFYAKSIFGLIPKDIDEGRAVNYEKFKIIWRAMGKSIEKSAK